MIRKVYYTCMWIINLQYFVDILKFQINSKIKDYVAVFDYLWPQVSSYKRISYFLCSLAITQFLSLIIYNYFCYLNVQHYLRIFIVIYRYIILINHRSKKTKRRSCNSILCDFVIIYRFLLFKIRRIVLRRNNFPSSVEYKHTKN